jgi:hypothetical protein
MLSYTVGLRFQSRAPEVSSSLYDRDEATGEVLHKYTGKKVSDIPAGDRKIANLFFYSVGHSQYGVTPIYIIQPPPQKKIIFLF